MVGVLPDREEAGVLGEGGAGGSSRAGDGALCCTGEGRLRDW